MNRYTRVAVTQGGTHFVDRAREHRWLKGKPEHRRGRVQLIDATQWFKPLRKNLGKKNCELAPDDIQRICDTYLAFKEIEQSKTYADHMLALKQIKRLPDFATFIDTSFVDAVKPT